MTVTDECVYCINDGRKEELMIEIAKLEVSTAYFFKEQTYGGRCLVALDEHRTEIYHLSADTRQRYFEDINRVAAAIDQVFHPDKLNYGAYGDTMPHLHFHLVPKYEGGPSWSTPFEANSRKVYLSDHEYAEWIRQLQKYI